MEAFPVEYRLRVIALTAEGMKSGKIAKALGVTTSWVRWVKRLHRAGQPLEPKSRANRRQSLAQREGQRLRARVAEHPGTTLEDLKRDLDLDVSITSIWNALKELGLSLKKKRSAPPSKTARTSSSHARPGKSSKPASIHTASFSSTKPLARRR
jgi:transposase